jgi:extradiol dioxygenase family protein
MQPILHLSVPVRDLAEARTFYVDVLGCEAARSREAYQDVWFYGMQVTKAKIADPSGNVIELKTYADVARAFEISPHSYPAAIEHGN